jgi:hypothetical protein
MKVDQFFQHVAPISMTRSWDEELEIAADQRLNSHPCVAVQFRARRYRAATQETRIPLPCREKELEVA